MHLTWLPLLALLLEATPASALRKPSNAVLLSKISTLTLRQGSKTSARRVSAIPQLTCEGPACRHYDVDVMRCKNAGSDYGDEDIQWTCTASLPEEFRLGSTDVTCEGYDNADDPYVLKGSCGVRYKLLFTEKGKEKFGSSGSSWMGSGRGSTDKSGDTAGYLFGLLFFGVAAWILWGMYTAWRTPAAGRRPGGRNTGFGGFGGGGGGGNDDPPPPYYPRAPKPPPSTAGEQQQQGWRPGFWTGLLGGAAATHLAGGMNRNRGYNAPPAQRGGGGWFGNNDNTSNNGGWGAGPSRPATRASSSSSFGSARYESTGFGSTSRR